MSNFEALYKSKDNNMLCIKRKDDDNLLLYCGIQKFKLSNMNNLEEITDQIILYHLLTHHNNTINTISRDNLSHKLKDLIDDAVIDFSNLKL